jgi:hypothetical protein
MHRDFVEMLAALNAAGAEYLVVGAHAMAVHGLPRATGDLDLWVRPSPENARRVWSALREFRAPTGDLTVEDLVRPEIVFQMGVPPVRIDLLTSIDGVDFEPAWQRRKPAQVDGTAIFVLGREDLRVNKRASGRPKDLADLAWLEREGGPGT